MEDLGKVRSPTEINVSKMEWPMLIVIKRTAECQRRY